MNYAANDAFAGLQVYKVLAQLRIRKADKHEEREDLEEKVSLSHSFSRVLNTFLGDFQAEKDDWKIHTQQSLSSVLVPPLQLASILSTSQRRSPLSPSSVKTYNLFHLDKLPTTDIASLLAIPVSKVYRHLLSHIFAGKDNIC